MAEQKFAPGPWKAEDIRHDGKWYVVGPDNATIIALCNSKRVDSNEANARLIAKAPEMYDLILEMVEELENAGYAVWPKRIRSLISSIENKE